MANDKTPDHKGGTQNTASKTAEQKAEQKAAELSLPKASLEKKITTKVVVGKRVNAGMVEAGPVQLYSIIGICTGSKVGESQYGGWIGFTGTFEAVRFSDGARFQSPVAFIPEPASSIMASALDRAAREHAGDVSLRFAYIIGAKASDKAAGFEYTVEPVQSAAQNDALAELRQLMLPKIPALKAPAPATAAA